MLYYYRRVIVLSADRHKNPDGLRSSLHRDVGPILNEDRAHGLCLVLILKQPNTVMADYAAWVDAYLRFGTILPGYREERA